MADEQSTQQPKHECINRDAYILAKTLIQLSTCCNMLASDANDYANGLLEECIEYDSDMVVSEEDIDANIGFSICCVERCIEHIKKNWPNLPNQMKRWERVAPFQDFSMRVLPNRAEKK